MIEAAHEPAGAAEQEALKAVEAQLSELGITAGRSGREPELVPTPRHLPRQRADQ